MNIIALISASVGIGLLVALVYYGNKIRNRWLRYLAIIIGVYLSISITGMLPTLFGDDNLHTASKAGGYMLYLGVIIGVIKSMFFRKKNRKPTKITTQPVKKEPQKNEKSCPNCGSSLSIRKATKGNSAGQSFWVCSNYPACKTVMALKDN